MKFLKKHYEKKGYTKDIDLRVKEKKRELINSIIIILGFFILFVLFVNSQIPENSTYNELFSVYSNHFENDALIKEISFFCGNNTQVKKLECVHKIVSDNFDYSHNSSDLINSPIETFFKGGVCRDWAIFYKAILNDLNITSEYNFSQPEHVFLDVKIENKTYILDQELLEERNKKRR